MARGPREGDGYSAGEPSKAPALPAPYPSWKLAAGHRQVASQACGRQSESPRRPRSHPVSRAPAGRQPPPLLTQASAMRGLSSRIPPRSPAGSCPERRLSQGGRGPSTLRPPFQDPLRGCRENSIPQAAAPSRTPLPSIARAPREDSMSQNAAGGFPRPRPLHLAPARCWRISQRRK